MHKRRFEVVCPSCKQSMQLFGDCFVNEDLEPHCIDSILDGSFFTRMCGFCFKKVPVCFPFLYDCPSKKTTIAFQAPKAIIHSRDVYCVDRLEELQEYVRILKSDVDIHIVLHVKLLLNAYEDVVFDAFEDNHLYFHSNKGMLCIPKKNV